MLHFDLCTPCEFIKKKSKKISVVSFKSHPWAQRVCCVLIFSSELHVGPITSKPHVFLNSMGAQENCEHLHPEWSYNCTHVPRTKHSPLSLPAPCMQRLATAHTASCWVLSGIPIAKVDHEEAPRQWQYFPWSDVYKILTSSHMLSDQELLQCLGWTGIHSLSASCICFSFSHTQMHTQSWSAFVTWTYHFQTAVSKISLQTCKADSRKQQQQ